MNFHQVLYNYLLDYYSKNEHFVFLPRQRNGQTFKIEDGFFLNGNNDYANAGLIEGAGADLSTKPLGMHFHLQDENTIHLSLNVNFNNDINETLSNHVGRLQEFLELEKSLSGHRTQILQKTFSLYDPTELYEWLDEYYVSIVSWANAAPELVTLPTQKRFNKLIDKIKTKSKLTDELVFLEKLGRFDRPQVEDFFTGLDILIEELDITQQDEKLTFNVPKHSVRLIVGQRVSWSLDSKTVRGPLEIITTSEEVEHSYQYEGKTDVYMTAGGRLRDFDKYWSVHLNQIKLEYEGATKSGYKNHENTSFLRAAFDKDYRADIIRRIHFNTNQDTQMPRSKIMKPLNQILYGPPGTGKTYETAALALEIIYGEDYVSSLSRKQIQQQYSELTITDWNNDSGRIAFCTFHQSFSYEDFVEGIKPALLNEKVIYEKEPGVFKRIADLAKQTVVTDNFETAYEKFVTDVQEDQDFELKTPVQGRPFKVEINSNHSSVAIPKTETATRMSVTKTMVKDYVTTGKIHDWKPYTTAIGDYLKENYKFEVKSKEKEPYILIIDEINRGNVASIFGELITLIEMDKRAGAENELSVILPYSKTKFSVPDNLHIIGTMNTADRSVEALDSALRRRFEFVEMMPDSKVIDDVLNNRKFNGFKISEILDTINERITLLIDRDHQIGHSYFLKLREGENLKDDLRGVFQNKIIPLLQEYFFNDYVKIAMVIGEGFLSKKDSSKIVFAKADGDYESDYNDRTIYEIASDFNLSTAIDLLMFKGNYGK